MKMIIKTLQKKGTGEFVHIEDGYLYTSDLPKPLSETATVELLIDYYKDKYPHLDLNDVIIVEFELVKPHIGHDVRNKLSPCLNLLSLLKLYFKETDEEKKKTLKKYVDVEMVKSEKCVKYIANLF